jgi:hypothetical protein
LAFDPKQPTPADHLAAFWDDIRRVFRRPLLPPEAHEAIFGKRILTAETTPLPRQPLVRPGNIVEKLCKFLAEHPGVPEPAAKLAAEADCLEFTKRDWWRARGQVSEEIKISRGRPKKPPASS